MNYRKNIRGDSMVDNNKLENLLADTKKYYKASNLYEAGCVNITRVADFWRNDKEVSGENRLSNEENTSMSYVYRLSRLLVRRQQ